MGTGYTRQSSAEIADSEIINAAPLNDEFNAIENAFHATTGHSHDGTSGEGPLINLASSVTGVLPQANGGIGNAYFIISGPATSAKTYTFPNASTTILTTNSLVTVAQGGTGAATLTGLVKGNGTSAFTAASAGTDYYAPGSTDVAVTDGGTGASDASGARTNLGLVPGTDVQAYDADTLKSDVGATLTAGYVVTSTNAGTKSSGTFTPAPGTGNQNMQYAVNGGAHTLAPPSSDCTMVIQYTNNGSAGAITTSGFTKVSGAFTTTNGDDFLCYITKLNGFSYLNIVALQ